MTTPEGRWPRLRRVFRLPFSRARIEADLREELDFHIEERAALLVAAGMAPADALAEARRRFGNIDQYRTEVRSIDEETMRQRTFDETIATLRREVALAARVLLRTPAFALIALTTLSLGIGASTAIFTVLDAVVLRPLPYPASSELVSVLHPVSVPGSGDRKWGLSVGGYFHIRERNRSFSEFGMYNTGWVTVHHGAEARVHRQAIVTASLLDVLGAQPHVGRLIEPEDDRPSSPETVVLSYEYWQREYAGDRSVVGRMLQTSFGPVRIIGVAEPGLSVPMPGAFASSSNLATFRIDLWMPQRQNPAGPFFNSHPYVGVGRLRPGVSVADAHREIVMLTGELVKAVPAAYSDAFMANYNFRGEAAPLKDSVLGPSIPRTLWALFGSVMLVLLIAIANVANLFVVRMDARRRESTVRTALGASRGQMATHYLAESMLLCSIAGVLGIAISAAGIRGLLAVAPTSVPRLASVSLSWPSMAFAGGVALLIGVAFGVLPLLRRITDLSVLREGGRGLSMSRRQRNFRSALVITQVAMALVLLAAAGLTARSFMHLRAVDPGFDSRNILAFDIALPFAEYDTREKAGAFHQALQRRIASLAGVRQVGSATMLPLDGYGTGCSVVWREGRPYPPGQEPPCVATPTTAPGFFETLRIPVRGRVPTWTDFDARTQDAVVTEALAERLWPGEDPIGKGIAGNGPDSRSWYRVIGVVPAIRAEALDQPPTEAVFYPGTSLRDPNMQSGGFNSQTYVVRADGIPPSVLAPTIRRIVSEMNPRVPFQGARTMEEVMDRSMARASFIMIMLGIASCVALLLSAVGIYGVISYVVTQRRFEIGVRIALGARVGEVATLVMLQSMQLAVLGILLGLAGTLAVKRVLDSMLFGISAGNPPVLLAVAITLLGIAALASFAPARRAAGIDPVEALRAN